MFDNGLFSPVVPGGALAILLHGVGSSGAGLSGLAEKLSGQLPDLSIAAPNGPHRFDGGQGYQWFSVRGVTEENRPARTQAALSDFRKTLEAVQARYGAAQDRTVLIGFSQGTIMTLEHVAQGGRVAGAIGLSGRLAAPPPGSCRSDVPLRLIHGAEDPVIGLEKAKETFGWLKSAGADVSLDVMPRLGHTIDHRVIDKVVDHVDSIMVGRLNPKAVHSSTFHQNP